MGKLNATSEQSDDFPIDRVDQLPNLLELGRLLSEVRDSKLDRGCGRRFAAPSMGFIERFVDRDQSPDEFLASLSSKRIFAGNRSKEMTGIGSHRVYRASKRLKAGGRERNFQACA